MAKKPEENYEAELQWKNWLTYINETSKVIEDLRLVAEEAYFDKAKINLFYVKLRIFITTRKPYCKDYDQIDKELKKIGKTLFSDRYINDLFKQKKHAEMQRVQYEIMESLNEQLGKVVQNLSDYELLPKVTKQEKDLPGAVRNQ